MTLVSRRSPESLALARAKEVAVAVAEVAVAAVVVAGPPKVVARRETPPNDWDEAKVLAVIDCIRDKYFCNPDESMTFVPTSDYSRFDGNERQATFCCRKERRTRTPHLRDVSALDVPPPPPPPRGPPGVHVDHVAYTVMVAEITQLRENKCLRLAADASFSHAPMPPGNMRSDRPTDQPSALMFGGRPAGTI